jgi:hypothetical protein
MPGEILSLHIESLDQLSTAQTNHPANASSLVWNMPEFTARKHYIRSADTLYEALHAKFPTISRSAFLIKVPPCSCCCAIQQALTSPPAQQQHLALCPKPVVARGTHVRQVVSGNFLNC